MQNGDETHPANSGRLEGPERSLRLAPVAGNPRNSEGDFIQLADGRWLLVYTHFYGGESDHAAAYLAGRVSQDNGRTWSAYDTVVLPNEGTMNIMSVSLLRLADGRIALFYLRKQSLADCRPILRISEDEAQSWSEPIEIVPDTDAGYYVVNNDRVVQLGNGRLVVPAARHPNVRGELSGRGFAPYGEILCWLSDDGGATWFAGQEVLAEARPDGIPVMLQEPGVVPLADGRLMLFCRTDAGSQYLAFSGDGGVSWSPLRPSQIVSPLSPASIKRIPATNHLLLVWNDHRNIAEPLRGKRTPLTVAVSENEGETWTYRRTLEDDPNGWYCYTAIAFVEAKTLEETTVLLAYCAGDSRGNRGLSTLQVTRVPILWLYR